MWGNEAAPGAVMLELSGLAGPGLGGGSRGLELELGQGEVLALLGAPGSGPGAALRLIAGLEQAGAGRVLVAGRDVTEAEPSARGIGMMVAGYGLCPGTSVAATLALPLWRLRAKDRRPLVAAMAARLGLAAALPRDVGALDPETALLTALGRAAMRRPPLLLLDEPLAPVEPRLRAALRSRLRRSLRLCLQETGGAAVIACADPAEAMALGDRVAVMDAGEVVQQGSPAALYDHPGSTFVAGLTGAPPMNLLAGEMRRGVFRGARVEVEGLDAPDGPAFLGFRPEAAVWLQGEAAAMGFTGCEIGAPLQGVEIAGDALLLTVEAGGGTVALRVPRAEIESWPVPGAPIRAMVPPDRCHVFDARSGRRHGRAWPG